MNRILVARLLDDRELRPQRDRQQVDCRRHDLRHDARPLTAAEDKQPEGGLGPRIGNARSLDHRRPNRIAGVRGLRGEARIVPENAGEAGRDRRHARREQTIGAAGDAVLFVDEARDPPQRRRQHRRNGRIAAEPNQRGRGNAPEQTIGRQHAAAEDVARPHDRGRVTAAKRGARDNVRRCGRKQLAVTRRPLVGDEIDPDAATLQRDRERLGGKQMAAGAACGDDHERQAVRRRHQPAFPAKAGSPGAAINSARGCSRESASNMPSP